MISQSHNRRSGMSRALVAPFAMALAAACAPTMPNAAHFSPLPSRLTDEGIGRDLQHFDSLALEAQRGAGNGAPNALVARRVRFAQLAKEAYERNANDSLVSLLSSESLSGTSQIPRTRRPELWALVDSARSGTSSLEESSRIDSLTLSVETALIRSQHPLLGAPSCDKWEGEAERLAGELRRARSDAAAQLAAKQPAPPVRDSAPPATTTPPIPPKAPNELHGVPSMVHFALDRSNLVSRSRSVLDALVDSLKQFPDVHITLEGHTDRRASDAYNAALSKRRSLAVRDYLIRKGIDSSRLRIEAFGRSQLESTSNAAGDHARNRRVLLRYYTPDGREIPAFRQLDDLQLERSRK